MRSHPLHRLSQALRHWRTDTKVSDARFIDAVAALVEERPNSLGTAFLKLEERLADRAWERSLRTFLGGFSKSELTALLHRFEDGAPATAAAESVEQIVASLVRFESDSSNYHGPDALFPGPALRGSVGTEPSEGMSPGHRSIYVIELDPACYWMGDTAENSRNANEALVESGKTPRGYLYVGDTGHTPELRFWKHQSGIQSSDVAGRFGLRLRPELGIALTTSNSDLSREDERNHADALRQEGWFVHQN
jgi:hypothetical protein